MFMCRTFVFTMLLLMVALPSYAKSKSKTEVLDADYGVALYHYFSGDPIASLSRLMVAEAKNGIQGHGDNPQIMRASVSLAFGMSQSAERDFRELLHKNRPKDVQQLAWFYLAKLHSHRGEWVSAQWALGQITEPMAPNMASDIWQLRTDLAIRDGQLDAAKNWLLSSSNPVSDMVFPAFNLATALSRSERYVDADLYYNTALQNLSRKALLTDNDLVLADKINIAAGYNQLLRGDNFRALAYFSSVQLDGAQGNLALLGYGRAAYDIEDYAKALSAWIPLSERELNDASAQEANLAVAQTYEKMGYYQQAMTQYRLADQRFGEQLENVNALLSNVADSNISLLDRLVEREVEGLALYNEMGNSWIRNDVKNAYRPKNNILNTMFVGNAVQIRLEELFQLWNFATELEQWQNKLTLYTGMLEQRAEDRIAELKARQAIALNDPLATYQATYQQHRDELERIDTDFDFLALLPPEKKRLLERIESSEERVETLRNAGESYQQFEETLGMYRGMLLWDGAQGYAKAYYQQQRSLQQIAQALLTYEERNLQVDAILANAPDLESFHQRIRLQQTRLEQTHVSLNAIIQQAEKDLVKVMSRQLHSQRRRLQSYRSQALLSIAKLYDSQFIDQTNGDITSPNKGDIIDQIKQEAPEASVEQVNAIYSHTNSQIGSDSLTEKSSVTTAVPELEEEQP